MSQKQKISLASRDQGAQPPQLYGYESLPEGPFTRYLILQPASTHADPLTCTLHTVQLNDIPPFDAISYVWGMPVKNQVINCNGKVIHITTNLLDALHQVQLKEKPRTLWVDLICINQADPKERGRQVSVMGNIYSKSSCTLLCLGPSHRVHAQAVSRLVADVDDMIQKVFREPNFNWGFNNFPFTKSGEPLLSHNGWESFVVLLQQPWFRRGWVVQEAALSRDALILWANTEIPWLKLVQAYVWYIRRALRLPNIQHMWLSELHVHGYYNRRIREAMTFGPEGAFKTPTLLEILDSARWLEITDPRDRIYAFASLPTYNKLLLALEPNYEISYFQAYRNLACEYLMTSQDLDILHFVHNDDNALQANSSSWIPRWNKHLYSTYTSSINNYMKSDNRITSKSSPHKVTISLDKTTLQIRTLLIDTVRFTSPRFDKNTTTPEDITSLWESVSTSLPRSPVYACSPLRAFVETFRCGVYRGRLEEWEILESAYMQFLQHELSREDALYRDAEYFHKSRMDDMHNKSFIISDRGYYGLAPGIVQDGDICCAIFGTRSPFILRKTGQTRHYKLVGSTLLLGKELDHNGYPKRINGWQDCQVWEECDLEEEDVFLC